MFDDTPPTQLEATYDDLHCPPPPRPHLTPVPYYLEEAELEASYITYTAANARQGSEEPTF